MNNSNDDVYFEEMDDIADGLYLVGGGSTKFKIREFIEWIESNNIELPKTIEEADEILDKATKDGFVCY